MTDNMKQFLEEASKNAEFQDKLIKANNDYLQAVIGAAKEQGINLTNEDIALLLRADKNHDGKISDEEIAAFKSEELQDSKVNEDELATVAGGEYIHIYESGKPIKLCRWESDCWCAVGGGGSEDEHQKTCVCVLGGAGELTEKGKEEVARGQLIDGNGNDQGPMGYSGSKSAPVAMWCALGGLGQSQIRNPFSGMTFGYDLFMLCYPPLQLELTILQYIKTLAGRVPLLFRFSYA